MVLVVGSALHHALIVTASDEATIRAAHDHARTLLDLRVVSVNSAADMLTPVLHTYLNGYCSFALLPDGSQEGYEDSDEGDRVRDELVMWLEAQRDEESSSRFDWVEVAYGSEDEPSRATRSSTGVSCPSCDGSGEIARGMECATCDGTGRQR